MDSRKNDRSSAFRAGNILLMRDWEPSASHDQLRFRAQIIKRIRCFFENRGYLEVETPVLSRFGITDVYIQQFKTQCLGQACFLQTSPEYPMKRLLAAGSGPIFQLARVFRDEELGRWHNPEFTLLEWYQLNIDHHGLMQEMDIFLQEMLGCLPMVKKTYQVAFEEICGFNPHEVGMVELQSVVKKHGLENVLSVDETDVDQYLFLLMSHVVEPAFSTLPYPVALYDFPISQAALSRIIQNRAARFEVYFQGVELANGFYELSDVKEQTQRFEQDKQKRLAKGLDAGALDIHLLEALDHGLPNCSGVALGVDRLIALAAKAMQLSSVLAFDFERS
jgi:elongation factor P--(R)-beta-lysine ligase